MMPNGGFMANRNWASGGKIYSMHVKPVLLDCNFIVDSANGNGLGIRSLKGPCVSAVYMHSSATFVGDTHTSTLVDGISSTSGLAAGMIVSGSGITAGTKISSVNSSSAITLSAATSSSVSAGTIGFAAVGSPNPAAGYVLVQLQDNYNRSYSGFNAIVSPISGSPLTSTTAGLAYTIVSLGTTTLAQWQAAGVPVGFVPLVGLSFIAIATGAIGGTGAVEVPATAGSNITNIETVGDPNASIAGNSAAGPTGAYVVLRCLKNAAIQAPADNSVISLAFYLSDSAILLAGE